MVAKEWKFIGKNRLILISVLAIMIIPFLYSIFFLKSVWNPYGETQHLPVAVVNNDKAVTYQGQKLDVGDQAVKSLKKDHQLGWRFVSEKKAKQGLKDKKYYTIVTFPKDTSKNAASVLSKNPKKMTIQYETNGSLNYIGEVISQIGATGLNEKIRQTVIKAYADATFSQVKKVGKGMTQAANGAKTLSKGQKTLGTGIDTYTAAVSQVNDGVQTMKMSVGPLASGVNQLADGGNTLNNGLQTLNGSTGSLANGTQQLATGSQAVNAGAQQYTAAVGQLNDGLGQLSANNGKITAGLQNIQSASAQLSQLPAMLTAMQSVHDATPGLQANMASLQSQMGALDKLAALKESLAGINVADLQKGVASANSGLNTVQSAAGTANDSFDKIVADIQNSSLSDADKQTAIAAISGDVKTGKTGALTAQAGAKAVNDGLSAQLTPLMSQMTPALSAINGIDTKQLSSTATTTFAQASALLNTANALTSQDTINQLKALEVQAGGMSTQLAQLQTYVNGVGTAANGAAQLNAQSGALVSGASQVANGNAQLNAQVPTLVSGVQQLANGSYQLAGGLNQLNGQIPTLSNGVAQLADGTSQLNANSPALKNGNKQLVTGSVKLSDSLGDGAKQVNSMPLSSKTSDMFSAPTQLKHKSYSTVKNYGHALAPYVLSVALYVGAIVFNFAYPIRKISMENQSATAWFFSKASVGLVVAIVQALVETGFMMLFGLEVMHPGMMFAVATAFSVASMFLVMFLSMLLDNPGRFIAMVLLMLQLGGSGGTFPMQVTNGFYNAIHPFLPMTYSILGLREGLTAGLGASTAWNATGLLLMMAVIFAALLWGTMVYLQHIHLQGFSQLDDNQKLQDVEK
ncbi:YhgE/Pip family protein [Furfurilactobacillus sp. WILCCON 0119]